MENLKTEIFLESGCLSEKGLLLYSEGNCSDALEYSIEKHLSDCELCSDAIEGVKMMSSESFTRSSMNSTSKIKELNNSSPAVKRNTLMVALAVAACLLFVFLLKYGKQPEPIQIVENNEIGQDSLITNESAKYKEKQNLKILANSTDDQDLQKDSNVIEKMNRINGKVDSTIPENELRYRDTEDNLAFNQNINNSYSLDTSSAVSSDELASNEKRIDPTNPMNLNVSPRNGTKSKQGTKALAYGDISTNPEYPGGKYALKDFLENALVQVGYRENYLYEKTVVIHVSKTGKATAPVELNEAFSSKENKFEAFQKLVANMKIWNPAMLNDEPLEQEVEVYFSRPIRALPSY